MKNAMCSIEMSNAICSIFPYLHKKGAQALDVLDRFGSIYACMLDIFVVAMVLWWPSNSHRSEK